jgi:hypothetical protein
VILRTLRTKLARQCEIVVGHLPAFRSRFFFSLPSSAGSITRFYRLKAKDEATKGGRFQQLWQDIAGSLTVLGQDDCFRQRRFSQRFRTVYRPPPLSSPKSSQLGEGIGSGQRILFRLAVAGAGGGTRYGGAVRRHGSWRGSDSGHQRTAPFLEFVVQPLAAATILPSLASNGRRRYYGALLESPSFVTGSLSDPSPAVLREGAGGGRARKRRMSVF